LQREAGDVASWSRQAIDETAAKRVRSHSENDRNSRCRLLCSRDCISTSHNDIDFGLDELRNELGYALVASLCPTIFDCDGPPLDPTKLT